MLSSQITHHFNFYSGMFYLQTPEQGVPVELLVDLINKYKPMIGKYSDHNLKPSNIASAKVDAPPECTS